MAFDKGCQGDVGSVLFVRPLSIFLFSFFLLFASCSCALLQHPHFPYLSSIPCPACVRACVCACVRVCVRVCVCACVRARARTHTHIRTCVCTRACVSVVSNVCLKLNCS